MFSTRVQLYDFLGAGPIFGNVDANFGLGRPILGFGGKFWALEGIVGFGSQFWALEALFLAFGSPVEANFGL